MEGVPAYPIGDVISIILQSMQIGVWSLNGHVWKFCGGAFSTVSLVNEGVRIVAGLDVTLLTGSGAPSQSRVVGINFVWPAIHKARVAYETADSPPAIGSHGA